MTTRREEPRLVAPPEVIFNWLNLPLSASQHRDLKALYPSGQIVSTLTGDETVIAIVLREQGLKEFAALPIAADLLDKHPLLLTSHGDHVRPYEQHQLNKDDSILFVYPGNLIPMINGSRRRAFEIILRLISIGLNVKLFLLGGNLSDKDRNLFDQMGLEIFTRKQKNIRQAIYSISRYAFEKLINSKPFMTRLMWSNDISYGETIHTLGKECKTIIFSHTWTVPRYRKTYTGARWAVDCHDVNFDRDANAYSGNAALHWFAKINRRAEISRLSITDSVIAISARDRDLLSAALPGRTPDVLAPDFRWISPVSGERSTIANNFGFIGTDMHANHAALNYIRMRLWPAIREARPNARLLIAGSISNTISTDDASAEGLVLLGKVHSPDVFYRSTDAILSPVVIPGGINFKIGEALAAGLPTWVTASSATSFPSNGLSFCADDSALLEDQVSAFLKFSDDLCANQPKRLMEAKYIRDTMINNFQINLDKILSKN